MVALAAVQLQESLYITANPHADVAWYVHPPALAEADYSAIDNLEESLVRRCGTEAIYVRWIGDDHLNKHCSTHGNLRCVGLHDLFKIKLLPKMIEDQMKCSHRYITHNAHFLPSHSDFC